MRFEGWGFMLQVSHTCVNQWLKQEEWNLWWHVRHACEGRLWQGGGGCKMQAIDSKPKTPYPKLEPSNPNTPAMHWALLAGALRAKLQPQTTGG